ncbi:MAG: family 78 glycoside hydrolase catalytic domain, partial [Planctomycetes bacterium]|nr:family 78 glycoside hydrolase catalytic domain [Planctomycetota bacterium]
GAAANLRPGRNVIAVRVTNSTGPAGLTLGIFQSYFGGEFETITPTEWLCSDKLAKGWNTPKFSAKGWVKAKVVGQPGDAPWGEVAQEVDGPRRSQMLRKEFELPAEVVRARAYVSGLGYYELRLNGFRVGDDVFTPGWTQYEKRIQYQVYDVTDLLKIGRNAVGAILGNGWWSSGLGWAGGMERHAKPGENLRFLLQLEVECTDGSKHVIVTDSSWAAHLSPIVEDTLYHGETHDARLEQPGWDKPRFDAKDWQPVKIVKDPLRKLCAQRGPTLRVTEELYPVKITEPKPGVYVLDFGQNHPGRPKLTVKAPRGTTIRMVHAEYLKPDGTLERANYRSARVTDTYICKGSGVEVWEPRFTYRGFRYMQVTGLPSKPDRTTIVSRVLHSAPPMAGTFECSNPLLNRILKNVRWGQRSNMHSVPTDCPQRDERLGWMGDAQAFAPTSIWNMDMALFFTKWMRDILEAQQPDGAVPGVCPNVGDWVIGPGRSAWADAITIIPWYVYVYYGDRQILEQAFPGVRKWVEYMQTKLSKDGLYEEPTWGDWVPVEPTPDRPIAAMFGYHSTNLLAHMAQILGKKKDADRYRKLAEAQRRAFNKKYLKPDNNYVTATQTSNILPLAFGMVEPDRQQAVADNIAKDVKKHGGHHTTGFLGTAFILPVLAQHGHADLAYGIVNTDEYPSLGYMIKKGATTIWERWNTDQMGPGMNSRNHFAFGSMAQWFYEGLAGLNPDPEQPGFKHVIVRPYIVGDLKWVRADYPTLYGRLASEWKREKGSLRLRVTIPPNTTATVCLPARDVARVTESGQPLTQAPGVTVKGPEGDRLLVRVAAGTYEFVIQQ